MDPLDDASEKVDSLHALIEIQHERVTRVIRIYAVALTEIGVESKDPESQRMAQEALYDAAAAVEELSE